MPASVSAATNPLEVGEGGMGEAYRARTEKLHREVAIKVLPAAFSAVDPFEQEAQAAGTLNPFSASSR